VHADICENGGPAAVTKRLTGNSHAVDTEPGRRGNLEYRPEFRKRIDKVCENIVGPSPSFGILTSRFFHKVPDPSPAFSHFFKGMEDLEEPLRPPLIVDKRSLGFRKGAAGKHHLSLCGRSAGSVIYRDNMTCALQEPVERFRVYPAVKVVFEYDHGIRFCLPGGPVRGCCIRAR
jgi:hypothetical protein